LPENLTCNRARVDPAITLNAIGHCVLWKLAQA
jgi:hypothetical protein